MVPICPVDGALWAAPVGLWFSSQRTIPNLGSSKINSIFAVIVATSPMLDWCHTGVDFIHLHKGSPTLGSPRRRLLLVCAMATTTNKGQSPMLMANWVCSHYWLSKQWSTDGGLASSTRLTLQTLGGLAPAGPQLELSCTSLHHMRLLHKEIYDWSVRGALPVRDNHLTVSANCLINDSLALGCSSTSLWGPNCSDWFASVNYWWGSELKC